MDGGEGGRGVKWLSNNDVEWQSNWFSALDSTKEREMEINLKKTVYVFTCVHCTNITIQWIFSHTVSLFLYSLSQRERRVRRGRKEVRSFSLTWLGGGGGEGGGTFIFIPVASVVGCRLPGFGVVCLQLYICGWFLVVGCRLSNADCRWLLLVPGCPVPIGCWALVVDCPQYGMLVVAHFIYTVGIAERS